LLARVPLTSYLGYLHVIRALPPDIATSIRDVTRHLTAESLDAYDVVKRALLDRFTTSELQCCYQLLDAPALGDRNIAGHYAQLRALIPGNGDALFNAHFPPDPARPYQDGIGRPG
jgi:hypothetical protein